MKPTAKMKKGKVMNDLEEKVLFGDDSKWTLFILIETARDRNGWKMFARCLYLDWTMMMK